ncbi:putative vacuolar protein sorting complex subunit [Trypanosoma grayi]|uniref:putative vacuolar protein sorting complex subunit n=1 Tax=Trypanosoma grayi TaxID=71804 RepID=UPI0004F4A5D4|nr:putative vacuolar protein sorting complex subunit [Trypanosoma grayi]KEG15158.1 putative vacuolar protein sorting complex subunit [Trypanosoma grayi]
MVRLVDFDDLLWELKTSLFDHRVTYCSFGGPLALYSGGHFDSEENGNFVHLYNAMGAPHPVTPHIMLDGIEGVLFMYWNECNDHLILVLNTGETRFFNLKGEPAAASIKVPVPSLCAGAGNGVALLINEPTFRLVLLECKEDGEYRAASLDLPSVFQNQKPNVMLVIPQQFSDTGYTEVFIPFLNNGKTSSFYHCVFHANSRCYDLCLSIDGGSVAHMTLSPSAHAIAFLVEDGTLYVASRSFEDITRLLNIDTDVMPAQFLWCGDKCIAYLHLSRQFDESLEFSTTLTLVNANDPNHSDFLNDIPDDCYLVSDCDGIRILSSDSYQFLQIVPEPSRRVFSVGSRANSAMLLLAFDEFMCGNASSVKMIRDLQKDPLALCEAVDDCVAAAGFEFDVSQQKRLLRVAAFGKSFSSVYESDVFVNMARRLRVLNTLRKSRTGMVMSQVQMLALEGDRLAERLVQMNHHQLAYCICDTLGYSTKFVMMDWALAKLAKPFVSANAEKGITHNVVEKLKQLNQTNFADIAYKAYLKQKPHAALLLLEAEKVAAKQIPRLLDIKQPEVALRKAVKCGDPDLIFTVMMHLINERGANAIPLLASDQISQGMLLVYVMTCESHRELLVEYFRTHSEYNTYLNTLHYLDEERRSIQALDRKDSSWMMLQEIKIGAIQSLVIAAKRETAISTANSGALGSAFSPVAVVSGFSTSLSQSNEKWLRLHMQLLDTQTKLMQKYTDKRFLNASVAKTISLCHEHGHNEVAERIKNDFGVSDKMYCWSMLKAYAKSSQWDLIDQIGAVKSKMKPVIGASAFVRTLLACGRHEQAKLYVPKVPRIEERMEFYVQCGDWAGAGADCRRHGEPELLAQLKERAKGSSTALQQIEEGWNSGQESGAVKFAKFFT